MTTIKNHDTILYQSRPKQFGHMTLKQFIKELHKEHKSYDLKELAKTINKKEVKA